MTPKDAPLELWTQMRSDDKTEADQAYEQIVSHYQYLVEGTARKLQRGLPDFLEDDELISHGQLGLLNAVERYEPGKGPFSRFASVKVYGAIHDGLRQADFAPRGLRKQQRDLDAVTKELHSEGVVSPTIEQLAEKAGMTVDEVREIQHRVVRADVAPADPSLLPSNRVASTNASLWSREMCREFVVWLKKFDVNTQKIVALKYWEGLSMKAISETLSLPIEQVRQNHQNFLSKVLPFMRDMASDS